MMEAKIQFSAAEMELMNNANIILTKNAILQKIKVLLEEVQNNLLHIVSLESRYTTSSLFQNKPKISRGENYQGLPYMVLDYPRQFHVANIFALRTMFWWGHFFSITLQLSGTYKKDIQENIAASYTSLVKQKFFISVGDDPWQHHFEEDNYKPISELSEEEFVEKCFKTRHLKIARNIPLGDVQIAREEMVANWQYLISLCIS